MSVELVLALLALVLSVVSLAISLSGRRRVEVITKTQAVKGENQLEIFHQDFLRELRKIGDPHIHIHDIEVLVRRSLDKLR